VRIIKKFKVLVIFMVLSFAAVGICQEGPTRTYYNNKVPYAAFFQDQSTNKLKVQVQTKGGKKVQAEIPVVNDVKKDKTQTKGD
jgi:hypothetical protein